MVKFSVENTEIVSDAIADAFKQIGDMTIPLTSITRDFYQSQKAIFMLKGPGQYEDLADSTKKAKERARYSVYPILKRTGRLADSTLKPDHPEAINKIINKNSLFIGTRVPYGIFHNSDEPRTKIPLRKFLFIGPEAKKFATTDQVGRVNRWIQIIDDYVGKVLRIRGLQD